MYGGYEGWGVYAVSTSWVGQASCSSAALLIPSYPCSSPPYSHPCLQVGHTSLDPTVGREAIGRTYGRVLHVKVGAGGTGRGGWGCRPVWHV